MSEAAVRSICAEFEIEIIPSNEYPKPGQTRCMATMCRILQHHGEWHLRLVISTLAETKGNQGLINEVSLWAVSDLSLACAGWIEEHAGEWLEAWDAIPLGWMMWRCQELVPIIKQRHALVGMMYLLLTSRQSRNISGDRQMDYHFMKRVLDSEGEPTPAALRRQEMIEAGNKLIEVKASLPRGEFLPWVKRQSGMSYGTVQRYMRLAKTGAIKMEEASPIYFASDRQEAA